MTEDLAELGSPGCDGISSFDLVDSRAAWHGTSLDSPGRLAVNREGTLVLATQANRHRALHVALKRAGDGNRWSSGTLVGSAFATFGGIAILDDGSFLVATAGGAADSDASTRDQPPFRVRRYPNPVTVGDERPVGTALGQFAVESTATDILVTHDSRANIVTARGRVHTVDLASLQETIPAVDTGPLVGLVNTVHPSLPNWRHSTVSADERYLVLNRGRSSEITVVDLLDRRTWTLSAPSTISQIGGLALGRGDTNLDLLALHAGTSVQVLRFAPHGPLDPLGQVSIASPRSATDSAWSDWSGPHWSLAWSTDGRSIIAASDEGAAEFVVITVSEAGRRLELDHALVACEKPLNMPNDVLTLHESQAPRWVPATPSIEPTPTSLATRVVPPTGSATDPPVASPTANATPTADPSSIPSKTPPPGTWTVAPSPGTPVDTPAPATTEPVFRARLALPACLGGGGGGWRLR